ncbi:hypothetical protein D4R89_00375 [bacterium]|nr:MAG: hypothetical protein D4R89_00375 [bacterium]
MWEIYFFRTSVVKTILFFGLASLVLAGMVCLHVGEKRGLILPLYGRRKHKEGEAAGINS